MHICRRLVWRACSLGMAVGAATTVVLAVGTVSPSLASASAASWQRGGSPRVAGHPGKGLSLAPPGLRSAVEKALGVDAGPRGNGFEQAGPGTSSDPPDPDFGLSVALSGSTALVGAPRQQNGDTGGAAYVFVRSGSAWSLQAKLHVHDVSRFGFGRSVALSGSTALIGAYGLDRNTGAVYVFVRSGSTWSQQAELTASDAASRDAFGWSVAVSGSTALIGATGVHSHAGAAYVFARSGSTWSQQAELTASDGAPNGAFGASVAVSGTTALVGAPSADSGIGAAYVFARSGSTWSQQAKLTASDSAGSDFGGSVTVSGSTALIGASAAGTGAAYVFVRAGSTWSQQAELTDPDGSGFFFGRAVAVRGVTALIGANAAANTGVVYVFVRSGDTWSQQAELTTPNGAQNDFFGYSVAVSRSTALAGAPNIDSGDGAAYVFVRSGSTWPQQAKLTPPAAA